MDRRRWMTSPVLLWAAAWGCTTGPVAEGKKGKRSYAVFTEDGGALPPCDLSDATVDVSGITPLISWSGGLASDVVVNTEADRNDDAMWAIQCWDEVVLDDQSIIPDRCIGPPVTYGDAPDAYAFFPAEALASGTTYVARIFQWCDNGDDVPTMEVSASFVAP